MRKIADREEGAAAPNQRQGQNQQQNQEPGESQKKMQRYTYYVPMIG